MGKPTCSIEGCERPRIGRKDYCEPHYRRERRGAPMDVPIPTQAKKVPIRPGMTCLVDECDQPVKAQGYCTAHYARLLRGTTLDAPVRNRPGTPRPTCSIIKCDSEADSAVEGAVCSMHRGQIARHGEPRKTRIRRVGECLIADCSREIFNRGMCSRHAMRAVKFQLSFIQLGAILLQEECDICGAGITEDTSHIDHDHACCPGQMTCGECVRGVLCMPCNMALGRFKDSVTALISAVRYLGAKPPLAA